MGRKLCVFMLLLLIGKSLSAVDQYWDGEGGDGRWSNAINWSFNQVPGVNDDVILDNSFVTTSYSVILPDHAVAVASLSMLPGNAFTITLILPNSNTVTSAAFATLGSGYSLLIGSGASFINNGSVSSGTNLVINDSMQIRSGGRYVHRTRSGHSTWLARLSRMPITANGTIEFDVPVSSYVISLSGRSYGNLVLNSQLHGVPVTYSGNGSQNVSIRGRLELMDATTLTLSFSGGEFLIDGDLMVASNSTFNLQASSNSNTVRVKGNVNVSGTVTETGTGTPQLILNGSSAQSVKLQNLQGAIVLDVNNSNGITLTSPLAIAHLLRLSSGKIKTNSTNLLSLRDNALIEGASFERYIDGPLSKIGDEAFTFPVGKGLQFASVALSAGSDVADEYICEYHQGNPTEVFGGTFETPGLTHMSSLEWWTIERRSGTSGRQVSLLVTTYSDATLLEHLRVLRYDGLLWKNEGNVLYSGLSIGTITSQPVTAFNSDGPTAFTLGSSSAFSNPLPVVLERFEVRKSPTDEDVLTWELADFPSVATKFYIEKDNGAGFHQIGIVESSASKKAYEYRVSFFDVAGEITRYRIRLENQESGVFYSEIRSIWNRGKIVAYDYSSNIVSYWSAMDQSAEMKIVDMQGKIIFHRKISILKGRNDIYVGACLRPGAMYIVVMRTRMGEVKMRIMN